MQYVPTLTMLAMTKYRDELMTDVHAVYLIPPIDSILHLAAPVCPSRTSRPFSLLFQTISGPPSSETGYMGRVSARTKGILQMESIFSGPKRRISSPRPIHCKTSVLSRRNVAETLPIGYMLR